MASGDQEVFIIFKLDDFSCEKEIVEKLIQESALNSHGQQLGTLHLTLALIKKVKPQHHADLKKSLKQVNISK